MPPLAIFVVSPKRQAWAALVGVVSLMSGCGDASPPLASVRGVVTLDGRPLADARVVFHQDGLRDSIAWTDAEGRYELVYLRQTKGAPLGPHHVSILTATPEGAASDEVPPQYNSQTTLAVEVAPGENVFDFPLQRRPAILPEP